MSGHTGYPCLGGQRPQSQSRCRYSSTLPSDTGRNGEQRGPTLCIPFPPFLLPTLGNAQFFFTPVCCCHSLCAGYIRRSVLRTLRGTEMKRKKKNVARLGELEIGPFHHRSAPIMRHVRTETRQPDACWPPETRNVGPQSLARCSPRTAVRPCRLRKPYLISTWVRRPIPYLDLQLLGEMDLALLFKPVPSFLSVLREARTRWGFPAPLG